MAYKQPGSHIFDREHEQEELRGRLEKRRPFLVHGESGTGKSLLMAHLCRQVPGVIYCASGFGLQQICLQVAQSIEGNGSRPRGTARLKGLSSTSLRGIVYEALKLSRRPIVLDHFGFASRQTASMLKSWITIGVPLVLVCRSPHMEELGHAASFFPEREHKVFLPNFDPVTAVRFTDWTVESRQLKALNLAEFKRRIVELSRGNPGMIAKLVEFAASPKYLSGGNIKITPLYLDVKLQTTGMPSR